MKVEELMTEISAGVLPGESLSNVLAMMSARSRSCVVISEDDYPKGILTERDVVKILATSFERGTLNDIPVSEVMTKDVVSVERSTSLYDALLLIREQNLRHLLVVDKEDKLLGIVTQTDIVAAYVIMFDQQNKLESANQALFLLSNEDELMRIGNRRAMNIDLNFTAASSKRYNKSYAVALLDVDFFKNYNDCYGHQLGDEALVSVVNAIKANMRDTDRLFRYGGEELLLLMPESHLAEAAVAAERARKAVEELNIEHVDSPFGFLSVSVGVAAGYRDPWLAVVKAADEVLYEAKESGRNKVVLDQKMVINNV
jgi:diguanylate cyclase (GGDEF)-like protein